MGWVVIASDQTCNVFRVLLEEVCPTQIQFMCFGDDGLKVGVVKEWCQHGFTNEKQMVTTSSISISMDDIC